MSTKNSISGLFLILFFAVGFLASSCSENPSSPPSEPEPNPQVTVGSLEITTITTGLDPNPRGYTVAVADIKIVNADANETVIADNLEEGNYSVELTEVEEHCSIQSENPVSADVVAGEVASVEFEVECKGIFREKIVFFRGQSQNAKSGNSMANESYFTMNYDGSDLIKAADLNKDGYTHYLSDISPDGTEMVISYNEDTGGSSRTFRIAMVDAYDSEIKYLIDASDDTFYFEPVFSPDGTKIAFTARSNRGLFSDIYFMNTDGSGLMNVTNSEELDSKPSWSPDGTKLVFERESTSYKPLGIYVINTDGTGLKLMINSDQQFENPVWSPNGDKIAMTGMEDDPYFYTEVYVMNSDGSNVKKVAGKKGDNIYHSAPKWSPDGSKILFASNRDGSPDDEFGYAYAPMDIFTVDEDGSNLMNLTNTVNIYESNHMWSP